MQQHAATFIAQAEDAAGADLPQFVKGEFDAFLECGILAHGFLRLRCGDCGHDKLTPRFGSAANLNIHLHCLVLDGVYRCGTDGTPEFVEVPQPTDEALHDASCSPVGGVVEEEGSTYTADNDGDSDEARTLRPLQGARPRDADFKQGLCAVIDGFSLHAAMRCGADDRQALQAA